MEILNKLFSGGKPKEESSNHEDEYMQEAASVPLVMAIFPAGNAGEICMPKARS